MKKRAAAAANLRLAVPCLIVVLLAACSRSNNLLLGRVEAAVGGHQVVVTDCYRTHVPAPRRDGATYRFQPCRDADVEIRGAELWVNGRPFGLLQPADAVVVDHGVVSIQGSARPSSAAK
jgi:hypothetical protein